MKIYLRLLRSSPRQGKITAVHTAPEAVGSSLLTTLVSVAFQDLKMLFFERYHTKMHKEITPLIFFNGLEHRNMTELLVLKSNGFF